MQLGRVDAEASSCVMWRREWFARAVGAALALAAARWWQAWLPLVGALALARVLVPACALWLAPALPRRRLPGLARRAVFVTGCDSGFGHAAALHLDALGARVFAGVLQPHGPGADRLRRLASGRLRVLPLDVTDAGAVQAARDVVRAEIQEHGCELWAVVNNAGILQCAESEWMDIDDLKQILDINTLGQIRVAQAFLPLLRQSKGRIVNLISLADQLVLVGVTPYVISKFAALAFSESLRAELSKFSITVHKIEPWIYRTNLAQGALDNLDEKMHKIPEDIKKTYSDKYREKMKQLMNHGINLTSISQSKIYQVSEAIEDACFAEDPLSQYIPGTHSKLIKYCIPLIHFFQPIFLKYIFKAK